MTQQSPVNYVTPPLKHPSYSSKTIPKLGLKIRKFSDYLNPSNLDNDAYNHDLKANEEDNIPLAKYSRTDLISRKSTGLSLSDYKKTKSKLYDNLNRKDSLEIEKKDIRTDSISENVERQQALKDKLEQM